jgi:Cysteine-rich CPCC
MLNNKQKFTCPCCGYKTHDREDSLWDVCAVCHWENEPLTLKNPYYVGGPNSCSLVQAQQNFILFGANDEAAMQYVRKPNADEPKDENWRPFDYDQNLAGNTNKGLTKNINLNEKWRQDWHTLTTEQFGVTSEQKGIWLLAYQERFTIELTYKHEPNDCNLTIKESEVVIFRYQSPDLEATKLILNEWIEKLNARIETILENKDDELMQFELRMKIDNKIEKAILKCWINWDWGHAQIRNVKLQIDKELKEINYTFTDFERMLFHVQRNELSEERKIETCFFCRYSCYNVVGNDDFGDLNCFKHCKEKIIQPKEKHALIALFDSEKGKITKVDETHYCADYQEVKTGDWLYKLVVR